MAEIENELGKVAAAQNATTRSENTAELTFN
jgi:hypothetical protein